MRRFWSEVMSRAATFFPAKLTPATSGAFQVDVNLGLPAVASKATSASPITDPMIARRSVRASSRIENTSTGRGVYIDRDRRRVASNRPAAMKAIASAPTSGTVLAVRGSFVRAGAGAGAGAGAAVEPAPVGRAPVVALGAGAAALGAGDVPDVGAAALGAGAGDDNSACTCRSVMTFGGPDVTIVALSRSPCRKSVNAAGCPFL